MKYKIAQYKYYRKKYENNLEMSSVLNINLTNALNNSKFLEQLYVASTSLYKTIEKFKQNPDSLSLKEKKHLQATVNKYFLRSKFRNTPFGLFSQISSSVTNKNIQNEKSLTIGFRWFYTLSQKIIYKFPEKFKYVFENSLTTSNNKIVFIKQTNDNGISKNNIQINDNKLIQMLKSYCDQERSFSQIKELIESEYKNVDSSYINNYIKDLINRRILRSSVYLPLDSTQEQQFDMILTLCNQLDLKKLSLNICSLRKLIHEYNESRVGEGISLLQKITALMNDIEPIEKEDIDVNFYAPNPSYSFPNKKIKDIENMVNLLCEISLPSTPLYEYIFDFIEKFGTNTEIPLGILINKNTGIGFPKSDFKEDPVLLRIQKSITEYFNIKIENALLNKKDVVLEEEDIKYIKRIEEDQNKKQNFRFPVAFDMCFDLQNTGEISISEIQGSINPYSMIGRFRKLDNSYIQEFFKQNYKNTVLCDLNVLPTKLELGNLINNKHYSNSELSIGINGNRNKKQIKLTDILIGINEKDLRLYLRLKESNKYLIFLDNNMLNIDLKHPIVKLLLDISNQVDKWWFNYPWKKWSDDLSYFPRILYKDIVIQNERWNFLPIRELDTTSISFEQFKAQLLKFKYQFNMPETVFYVDFDNKIPTNFEDYHIYELYKMWEKNPQSKLHFEKIPLETLQGKTHTEEVVCTLSQESCTFNDIELESKEKYAPIYPVNLENNWIYTNIIFTDKDKQIDFLKVDLENIANAIKKYTEKDFFIQYENEKRFPTIRYRVKLNNNSDVHKILSILFKYLSDAIKDERIKDFTFNNYFPEIYRYGGQKYLSVCESIFYWDSQIALYAFKNFNDSLERQRILTYSAYTYMISRNEAMSDNMQFTSYFNIENKKMANKWFRENKEKILSLKNDRFLNNLIIKRQKYVNLIMSSTTLNESQKDEIMLSLLHMNANRIVGINRTLESQMMFIATNFVKNDYYKKSSISPKGR